MVHYPSPHRRRNRAPYVFVTSAAVIVVLVIVGTVFAVRRHDAALRAKAIARHDQAVSTVRDFLANWQGGHYDAVGVDVTDPAVNPGGYLRDTATRLALTSIRLVPGTVEETAPKPSAGFRATLTLAGLGEWAYDGSLPLAQVQDQFLVDFAPAAVYPTLGTGQRLTRVRTLPKRGSVLFADGRTPIDGADGELSGNLVGQTKTLTAQAAAALGARYAKGDIVGASGLQRAEDDVLRGVPSGAVQAVDAAGKAVGTLKSFPGTAGKNVVTTIDLRTQRAGEAALAGRTEPAALVALDSRTGKVLALVNHPLGGYGRALRGTYPPGSTFKLVTATAALLNGKTPETPLSCPPMVTVEGRMFANAEHEQFGTIPFHEAFARSCNTAFINLEQSLPAGAIGTAAALYGFNLPGDLLPLASAAGSYPAPGSPVEAAAQAIGQGRDIESPLQNASIAAAIASGSWHQPSVTVSPAPTGLVSHRLPGDVATTLRSFMREVVTNGTGTAANLPGIPVYGKTGTAEFGSANPPQTHAWFVGFRGPVAFAVVVEGGGFGGAVAAPIAANFLTILGG